MTTHEQPEPATDSDPLLTVTEAAHELGDVGERWVRRLIQERRIRFVRLAGSKVRIPRSAITELVEAGTVPARDAR
jgi:excisionase family DNA binding protein